jgi:uncharacterized membrane protein
LNRIARIFLAGLLALLPLIITIAVTAWVVTFATGYVGPGSRFGRLLTSLGLSLNATFVAPYVLGLAVVLALIFLLGLVVETRIGPWFEALVGGIVGRVPGLSNLYDLTKRFVAIVDTRGGGDSLKSMSPVWCHFGGEQGAAVLALMPSSAPVRIGSDEYLGVLIPTAPVPFGGCLIYVPSQWIRPAEGGVERLMSVYVSMGVTPPHPTLAPSIGSDKARG